MKYEVIMEICSNKYGTYDTKPFEVEAENEKEAETKAAIDVVKGELDLIKDGEAQTFTSTIKSIKVK